LTSFPIALATVRIAKQHHQQLFLLYTTAVSQHTSIYLYKHMDNQFDRMFHFSFAEGEWVWRLFSPHLQVSKKDAAGKMNK
jgi:hypothetical protein